MSTKVLVTCPPMLRQIERFSETFVELGMEVTTPDVLQTVSEEELIQLVPEHDGWIIGDDPATSAVFEAGKNGKLKAAVKWGIGTDNVDFEACRRLALPISNTPGLFGAEVSDLAMCYLLGLARDAFYIDREVRNGNWTKPSGVSLSGKTLGIIGLGDIGKNVAKRANAHDLKIIGWDPYAKTVPDYVSVRETWPEDIGLCDFLVFACSLTDQTFHMFDDRCLGFAKHGVMIINISRGPLIDEETLLGALEMGSVHSAALDVFEAEPLATNHRILDYPKCIVGSHNGSNTVEAVHRASEQAIALLSNFLSTK